LQSGARSKLPATKARYTLLLGITAKGEQLLVTGDEIEAVKGPDGRYGYVLTDEGVKDGLTRLQWTTAVYNDRGLHGLMGSYVYQSQTLWDFVKRPTYWTAAFFVALLFIVVPKDRARRMVWKFGRRLRGPGAGHDGGVQREAGPEAMAEDLLSGRNRARESRTDLVRPATQA
jgi:hypothetical protein